MEAEAETSQDSKIKTGCSGDSPVPSKNALQGTRYTLEGHRCVYTHMCASLHLVPQCQDDCAMLYHLATPNCSNISNVERKKKEKKIYINVAKCLQGRVTGI